MINTQDYFEKSFKITKDYKDKNKKPGIIGNIQAIVRILDVDNAFRYNDATKLKQSIKDYYVSEKNEDYYNSLLRQHEENGGNLNTIGSKGPSKRPPIQVNSSNSLIVFDYDKTLCKDHLSNLTVDIIQRGVQVYPKDFVKKFETLIANNCRIGIASFGDSAKIQQQLQTFFDHIKSDSGFVFARKNEPVLLIQRIL